MWLRLCACILGAPLLWLSTPVAQVVGVRLYRFWPSWSLPLLGGFAITAPQKPTELIQYSFTAGVLVAYLLVAFRQIEVVNGERRKLLIDRAGERFRLSLVVCGFLVVSVLLCIFAARSLTATGLFVECWIWLAFAVSPFVPAYRRKQGLIAGTLASGAPGKCPVHVERDCGPQKALANWAPRVLLSVVVCAGAAMLIVALWPFLTGRLVILNEYPDLREYVKVAGTNGKFVSQSVFIATNSIGGLVPYEPLRDKGQSPKLPAGMAVKLGWNSQLASFLSLRGQQAIYDVTLGAVVFIGDYNASDIAALKACAVGATERRRVEAFAIASRRRMNLIQFYSPA